MKAPGWKDSAVAYECAQAYEQQQPGVDIQYACCLMNLYYRHAGQQQSEEHHQIRCHAQIQREGVHRHQQPIQPRYITCQRQVDEHEQWLLNQKEHKPVHVIFGESTYHKSIV